MPPKRPKPQKVDLKDLLAAPAPATAASRGPACAQWGKEPAKAFTPAARPKPKPKPKPKAAAIPIDEPPPEEAEEEEEPAQEEVAEPDAKLDAKALKELKAKKAADLKAEKASQKKAAAAAEQAKKLDEEVEAAREKAVMLRSTKGAFNGGMEIGPLTLPNPGGGVDLLEDVSFNLTPGRRYGLIGRNGKGKSTLLRYLAARRVGGMPESVTVHYVSQEVSLTAAAMDQTPAQAVVEADVERRLLLAEQAALEGKTTREEVERLETVTAQLEAIGADTAEERAVELLMNLGFSEELRSRTLGALSGGRQASLSDPDPDLRRKSFPLVRRSMPRGLVCPPGLAI